MQHFIRDEAGYDLWVQANPGGLTFSRKRLGHFMVHESGCDHVAWFGPREGTAGTWQYTAPPGKWCFESRMDAAAWVRDNGYTTVDCRDCAPAFRPHHVVELSKKTTQELRPDAVDIGNVVVVFDIADEVEETYWLSSDGKTAPTEARSLSSSSPLAAALLGKVVGETVQVAPAAGSNYEVRIVAVR